MKADAKLDIRGMVAPYCFLMFKSTLASMKSGEILEITACDPDTISDLHTILDRSGEQLVAGEQGEDFSRLWVRKGSDAKVVICKARGGRERSSPDDAFHGCGRKGGPSR